MKKELNPYDYYYDSNAQPPMMVANGDQVMAAIHHPFNMQENFLQILGKHRFIIQCQIHFEKTQQVPKPAANSYFFLLSICLYSTTTKKNMTFPSSFSSNQNDKTNVFGFFWIFAYYFAYFAFRFFLSPTKKSVPFRILFLQ